MRVNLLPAASRPAPRFDGKRLMVLALFSFLLFLALLGTAYFFVRVNSDRKTLEAATDQLQSLQPKKARVEQIENQIAEIRKSFDNMDGIRNSYPEYVAYLNTISNALVDEVWLKNISFTPGNAVLDGNSLSVALVGDILRNLDKGNFTMVRLMNVTAQTNGSLTYYSFTVNIEMKDGGAPYAQSK